MKEEGWRLRLAGHMRRAAHGLEFFSLAVPRPDDLVAANRQFYTHASRVDGPVEYVARGLFPHEIAALEKFAPSAGAALVLGCGAGREAIALSRRGWKVTGVDVSPMAIEAAKTHSAKAGVEVDWRCQDMTSGLALERCFDLVSLFGLVYSLIPDRRRRIGLLRTCRDHMPETGVCLLDFGLRRSVSDRERRAHWWRKHFARAVAGNLDCQVGDQWQLGSLFFHAFASAEEVVEEASAAGFTFDTDGNQLHAPLAVLRPARVRAPVGADSQSKR